MKLLFSTLLLLVFVSQNSFSQTQEQPKKKEKRIEIEKKTVDENGEVTVTKIVWEGNEVTDKEIDRLLKENLGEEMTIDVEVTTGEEVRQPKIRIVEQGVEVEEVGPEKKVMVFKSDDGTVTKVEGDDVIIIKKEMDGDGEVITETIEGAEGEPQMIWIEKEGGAAEGDVIIIEEEITEKTNADGTVTKKTVRKKTVKKKN